MNLTLRQYRNVIKNAIKRSLPHCMDRFPKGRTFQEPDYTAGLAFGLPQLLNTQVLKRLGLRFGGCFIHQSPLVTYLDGTQKVTRELGDLLILCRERIDDEERFNAVLLQLKMAGEKKDVEAGQLHSAVFKRVKVIRIAFLGNKGLSLTSFWTKDGLVTR